MSRRSSSAMPSSPRGEASSPAPPMSSSPARRSNDDDEDEPSEVLPTDIAMDPRLDSEDEGEELIGDGMEKDYRAIPELDVYDPTTLAPAGEEHASLSPAARRRAERDMKKRERAQQRGRGEGRVPRALAAFESDSDEDDQETGHRSRRRRLAEDAAEGEAEFEYDESEPIIQNLEDRKGNSLREWVVMDAPRSEIKRRFRSFLTTFVDKKGNNVHAEKIRAMCEANGESLVIGYRDLCDEYPVLAIFAADAPTEVLEIFDEAAKEVVLDTFPAYDKIRSHIHVRISSLPLNDAIRDIRQIHLNGLIKVSGVVTRRTGVYPQLMIARYQCDKCSFMLDPVVQSAVVDKGFTGTCPNCHSLGPYTLVAEETIYRNYQRITVQESPGSVPAGRLPRQKEVILLWDLVDSVKPGDEVEITGIYRNNFDYSLNSRHGFPLFATVIEANYLEKTTDSFSKYGVTDDEKDQIHALAADENVGQKIINSIAPSIYGHTDIKTALALSMFAGVPKNPQGKHRIRGDINILVLGDPGTAKSQFLKYVEHTAPRAVFTTGQGASAVGLTASVQRDAVTREWTLQGGALVLADQGVCLIDEFDKMNDQDRTSIHEAMEQQTISISKAGIVTRLQARCAVIAAANPIRGKYQPSLTLAQNVDLTEPILSRFDVVCVVKDTVDPVQDERLANFVVGSHMKSYPSDDPEEQPEDAATENPDLIPQELLRKYIQYARSNYAPKLNDMDQDKISKLYRELRKESESTGSFPVTMRHVESIIRLSEAHARMHLRSYVRDDDINTAIRVILTSFIESQKFSVMKTMQRVFNKYIMYKRDNNELLFFVLSQLVRETLQFEQARLGDEVPDSLELDLEEFSQRARQLNIHDLTDFFASEMFLDNNYTIDEAKKAIVKAF